MRIAFLTSLGHSEKKEKTVSYGRSDNGDGAKRCEQEKQLSPSLFVFSLLSRRAALQLCERVELNRLVECYAPRLFGLLRPRRIKLSSICIIDQFLSSLILQLPSILLSHHLHFFPLALRTHRLHVWHSLGPLGCG